MVEKMVEKMRVFGVFNTKTGLTERVESIEQASDMIAGLVAEMVLEIRGRCPITVIDIAEDGTETWRGADGVEVPTDEARQKAMALLRSKYDWVD